MSVKEKKSILITGGAGFIGSNFISFFLRENTDINILNLDKLTYAGNPENLAEVAHSERYVFIKGDICDVGLLNRLFRNYKITGIINFAAESHVDNSIESPDSFIKTNIEGTFVLLETARKYWLTGKNKKKPGFEKARFHHISTDEVYGSLGDEGFFTEKTAYAPNSPYSASKAASDFLVRSYHHTYGLDVVTSNCSNNYGPKQHDEKLMPTIIRKALSKEPIPIYGNGKNIRDWLFVEDHCKGIAKVFQNGKPGETYVMGAENEQNNLFIAKKICAILNEIKPKDSGVYEEQISFVEDRPGHDWRYAVNAQKITDELSWQPRERFDTGLRKTVKWYVNKYKDI